MLFLAIFLSRCNFLLLFFKVSRNVMFLYLSVRNECWARCSIWYVVETVITFFDLCFYSLKFLGRWLNVIFRGEKFKNIAFSSTSMNVTTHVFGFVQPSQEFVIRIRNSMQFSLFFVEAENRKTKDEEKKKRNWETKCLYHLFMVRATIFNRKMVHCVVYKRSVMRAGKFICVAISSLVLGKTNWSVKSVLQNRILCLITERPSSWKCQTIYWTTINR